MRRVDLLKEYGGEGIKPSEVWKAFEADWRQKIRDCAWVRVSEILGLTQSSKGWTIRYRIRDAKMTQPINPDLAFELLAQGMVGSVLGKVFFVVNPKRVEECVVVLY